MFEASLKSTCLVLLGDMATEHSLGYARAIISKKSLCSPSYSKLRDWQAGFSPREGSFRQQFISPSLHLPFQRRGGVQRSAATSRRVPRYRKEHKWFLHKRKARSPEATLEKHRTLGIAPFWFSIASITGSTQSGGRATIVCVSSTNGSSSSAEAPVLKPIFGCKADQV